MTSEGCRLALHQKILYYPKQSGLEMKRKQQRLPEYLTEDQVASLFEAIGDDVRSQAIFHVIYHRGLRASEVGLLQLEDYRPAAGRLLVRRLKGSRGGEYHLLPVERTWLNRWLRERGSRPGPLFVSRNHGPISARQSIPSLLRGAFLRAFARCPAAPRRPQTRSRTDTRAIGPRAGPWAREP